MIRPAACQVRRSRGHAQNVNICTPALMATKYPAVEHKAGPRAFSRPSPIAQRDAGTERRTLRAAASSCALTLWIAAASSTAA